MSTPDHRNWLQQLAFLFLPVLLYLAVPAGYTPGPEPQHGEGYEQNVHVDIILGLRPETHRSSTGLDPLLFLVETGLHFRAARPPFSFHSSRAPLFHPQREAWGTRHIRGPPAFMGFPLALI